MLGKFERGRESVPFSFLQGLRKLSFSIMRHPKGGFMRKFFVLAAAFVFTCSLWAQEKSPRGVTTTGTAEINVAPDEVLLQVGVQNQSPRARAAKAAADVTSRKILTALK